ncbi:MAG: SAM-dependent methyltransferase [Bacillariaceae sp.]|jgi:SAM-dependent methyltransferase
MSVGSSYQKKFLRKNNKHNNCSISFIATAFCICFLSSFSMRYSASAFSHLKASVSNNNSSNMKNIVDRAKFLSASAATFASGTAGFVAANLNPEECEAKTVGSNNPRYIEKEIEMAYGKDGEGNPRSRGMLVRRLTGDSTPYKFPVQPVRLVQTWPEAWPFTENDFSRSDPSNDKGFYTFPKLVYHIDEPAVSSLTQYYRNNIPAKSDILDICSSWVSHYPLEFPDSMKSISATGINGLELSFNDQLTGGYEAQDLNENPTLPYKDESFDAVTCVVSIDYLIEPVKVLKEVYRVLRPGGRVILSQSNRCFPTKAIAMVRFVFCSCSILRWLASVIVCFLVWDNSYFIRYDH